MSKNRFLICDLEDLGCLYQCPDCKHVWFNTGSIHPVYCPECISNRDGFYVKKDHLQGLLARINKKMLKSSVPFMRKLSYLDEVDRDQVPREKVTKIYRILIGRK